MLVGIKKEEMLEGKQCVTYMMGVNMEEVIIYDDK